MGFRQRNDESLFVNYKDCRSQLVMKELKKELVYKFKERWCRSGHWLEGQGEKIGSKNR